MDAADRWIAAARQCERGDNPDGAVPTNQRHARPAGVDPERREIIMPLGAGETQRLPFAFRDIGPDEPVPAGKAAGDRLR
jgi:hypothetical protein